jgi:hypothetical protein
MRNVDKHYPVVGVLEKFKETLELVETNPLLSRFFRGASQAYNVLSKISL